MFDEFNGMEHQEPNGVLRFFGLDRMVGYCTSQI
jgi:hypothetical protein